MVLLPLSQEQTSPDRGSQPGQEADQNFTCPQKGRKSPQKIQGINKEMHPGRFPDSKEEKATGVGSLLWAGAGPALQRKPCSAPPPKPRLSTGQDPPEALGGGGRPGSEQPPCCWKCQPEAGNTTLVVAWLFRFLWRGWHLS